MIGDQCQESCDKYCLRYFDNRLSSICGANSQANSTQQSEWHSLVHSNQYGTLQLRGAYQNRNVTLGADLNINVSIGDRSKY